jgi:protein-S-isoprenylcysteine O-methyltransferase Ste14
VIKPEQLKISRHLRAIFSLPFVVLVVVPSLLLLMTTSFDTRWTLSAPLYGLIFLAGMVLILTGIFLLTITVTLFATVGEGTLAPWDPTQKLVVQGPYQHTRNPMIMAVLTVLLGESVLMGSWAILLWTVFFFTLNHVYFIFSEEPGLEKRFDESYRQYKQHVPRWIPRLTPWQSDAENPLEKQE